MQTLEILGELHKGGEWLCAARRWMQSNVRNGDMLTWGSGEPVTIPFWKLEELALRVAVAAVAEDRAKRARFNAEISGERSDSDGLPG